MEKTQRVTFSPGEFAALFGKAQTWGYRQLYSGKVKATTEYGRIMIPASEVERILATAGIYDGIKPRVPQTKSVLQKLAPKLGGAWQKYLLHRRQNGENKARATPAKSSTGTHGQIPWTGNARQAALKRLGGQRNMLH
ncbi:MAG TPA: hypothetical protein VG347_08475 [Verrucomicrobiae bacterium]|nr:hypothetical protein [Verrucomicrobiae bacterium]